MKRHFYTLGLMLAATFTLTNCAQEIDNPNDLPSAGIPFEIVASSTETKTVNSSSVVSWVAGDALNIFHAEAGVAEYKNDNNFTIAAEDLASGRFTGALTETLTADSYDWYAFYPYISHIITPANTSKGYTPVGSEAGVSQTQNGYDNMNHIAGENYPLYGVATGVASNVKPSFEMKHAYAIAKIVVKNTTEKELTVKTVSFTAPEAIVGTYYINFVGETPVYTGSGENYVSNIANLTVSNGTALAKDAVAVFYLAFKPFTAAADSELKIAVNGYEKTLPLENSVTFAAGKIKTLNFAYDKVEEPAPEGTATVTVDLTAQGYSNQHEVSTLSALPVNITFDKGTNSNTPKYFTSGTAVRVYGGSYFTVSSSLATIVGIELTYGSDDGTIAITTDCGTFTSPNWTGSSNSVKFTISGTSGHRRIQKIKVTYLANGDSTEPVKLETPIVTCAAQTASSLTFRWEAIENASKYEVLFGDKTEDVTSTSYSASGLNSDTEYEISVKAVGDGTYYTTSDAGTCTATTDAKSQSGEETTVSTTIAQYASIKGWSNSTKYDTINLDDVITATATGGSHTGKYYTSGNNWRIYQNESPTLKLSADGEYTIKTVKITYSVENTGVLTLNGSNIASETTVEVNAASISFGVGNTGTATNGQVRVTAIEVVYQAN